MDNLEKIKKAETEQDEAIKDFKKKWGTLEEKDLSVEEKIQYLEDSIMILQKELMVHTAMFDMLF